MGTNGDWMRVFLTGVIWVGGLLLLGPDKRDGATVRSAWYRYLAFVSMGLFVGLLNAFEWRAFHTPLVFLTGVTFLGSLAAIWFSRPKPPNKTSDNLAPLGTK
jgi:hypothetical protein